MRFVDLTFPTPAENLACDQALLEWCSAEKGEEILRVWESPSPFVVVGYGNTTAGEVDLEACRRHRLPVLRRISGGGAVLQGPGCLNYSLILRIPEEEHPLRSIAGTNRHITRSHAQALRGLLGDEVRERGLSDIARGLLKFSGNAQRRTGSHLLFHGTILREFDLPLIEATLAIPERQPRYRANRPHRNFLVNTAVQAAPLVSLLRATWQAHSSLTDLPYDAIWRIANTRYADEAWTFSR